MEIANPIYDVVFKYLMEDNKVAKLMLSTIIGENIITLEFLPNSKMMPTPTNTMTVIIMDFAAKIETETGETKQVIIELQKAKFSTDIIRFRKYLGGQYSSNANIKNKEGKVEPLPIISIYFLGYTLAGIDTPIMKANRIYLDMTNNQEIHKRAEFIECLTHDCFIIQIPHLRQKYQSDIENLLSIFDQSNALGGYHILKINPENYREKYGDVIRRLQKAIMEENVRDTMDMEDTYFEEITSMEREIISSREAIKEKDEALAEKDNALQENQKVIAEKDTALQEKEQALAEKDKELEKYKKLLAALGTQDGVE
jgi:hypothetical protein